MSIEEKVEETLREIVDPCAAATGSELNIVEMGLVKSIAVQNGDVTIDMRITTPACHMIAFFHEKIDDRVGGIPDVDSVQVEMDNGFEWTEDFMSEEATERRQQVLDRQEEMYREAVLPE